jgi:hypothetical protein
MKVMCGESYTVIQNLLVGFEVFTAVVLKSIIFWDMTTRRHIPEDDTLQNLLTRQKGSFFFGRLSQHKLRVRCWD